MSQSTISRDDVFEQARDLVRRESDTVGAISDLVGNEAFIEVVDLLLATTGKVITSGSGTSGTVARRTAHLLSVCGTPGLYLNPTDALHGSLGAIAPGDVVIAVSKGGGTGELTDFASRAQTRGAKVIAMTCRDDSALVELADITVLIPAGDSDPGNAMAMGSTFAMGSWADALCISLMALRGYTWEEFLFTHPGGRVGEDTDQILANLEQNG